MCMYFLVMSLSKTHDFLQILCINTGEVECVIDKVLFDFHSLYKIRTSETIQYEWQGNLYFLLYSLYLIGCYCMCK